MANIDLVKGQKDLLIVEFERLYKIHGRRWRSLLKKQNDWHCTDKGLRAWQNISHKSTGNEALRLIISDMRAITVNVNRQNILQKHGLGRSKSHSL